MTKSAKYLSFMCATILASFSAAQAQDTMYVAGFGGTVEATFREKIIPAFEAKSGMKIVYVAGNSTDTLAKLQAQKEKPEISVALIDDGPMNTAVQFGLCAKIEDGPNLKDVYPNARKSGDLSIGLGYGATGLVYNTEVFKKNGWAEPTSWKDLADPKFKGKIIMPPISNGFGLLGLVMQARLNGGGENDIDAGFQAMKKISPNVLAFEPAPGRMAELLQTGEAAFGVWGSGRVRALVAQGAPVKFVFPKEGAAVILTEMCPVAGAPQAKQAQEFVQFLLSPEIQTIIGQREGWGPVNSKAKLTPEETVGMVYGEKMVASMVVVDYGVINPKRQEWTNRWNREVER
ncbi:ABC transporter substrate-binding protein [Agrobacterium vaccinii]|uniref:ABC transporter substrate-binding protein n=1 Tax=Agrobacterium vaccinii TaxID=2735528 RepID=UPI001E46503D|nr:ABC transporter substrate-binding protein [Agrobacterium vaccinii]